MGRKPIQEERRVCEWCKAPLPEGYPYLICDYCRRSVIALIEAELRAGGGHRG